MERITCGKSLSRTKYLRRWYSGKMEWWLGNRCYTDQYGRYHVPDQWVLNKKGRTSS
ncbi:hypothetical protein OK016_16265 [Vibrio chagasii]|nr:hypothetical protein [Vibrio chagasii]